MLSVIGVFIIATGSYAFYIWNKAQSTIANIQENIGRDKSDKRDQQVNFKNRDPISILLMGVDERKGDRGRSDSLILMTVNPKEQSMEMVSIPRDTRTEIVGKGIQDKINHAYAFGGTEMAIKTVENFLDVPVDYFVKVNMESFRDIVDAVGGVTVENDLDFTYEGYHFEKGTIHLDGKKLLRIQECDMMIQGAISAARKDSGKLLRRLLKREQALHPLQNLEKCLKSLKTM